MATRSSTRSSTRWLPDLVPALQHSAHIAIQLNHKSRLAFFLSWLPTFGSSQEDFLGDLAHLGVALRLGNKPASLGRSAASPHLTHPRRPADPSSPTHPRFLADFPSPWSVPGCPIST